MTGRGTAASAGVPPRTWRDSAGAWLGLGAAPGALVLGAQIGGRHDGHLPLQVLVAGGVVMALLLAVQGRLGLRPPAGEDATLSQLTPRYLPRTADRAITVLLAMAMVGWFGFNVGLGGGAVAALTGVPDPAGIVLLGLPITAVLLAGAGRWNGVAVATTLSAIALIAIVAVRLAPPEPVLTTGHGGDGRFAADVAGYLGYVAVFAVRAPDFTVGFGRRRDLAWCVALLVGAALAASTVGAGLAAASGSTDVVAVLAGPDGLAVANLFVAASVVAPTLTTMHSGALAVRRFGAVPHRAAVLAIAGPGLVLALFRVDRMMLAWLSLLAAVLPALVVPMAVEAARRRRGRAPRPVPTWTWAPASALALGLTVVASPVAALAGLGAAVAATAAHTYGARRADGGRGERP
ncbi:hypothetical protein [Actinomadura alba]|uniref:Purine-cytosine permease n=1 Tax=Actinomadura alba TaxID=406431 RepID=A0ABR7LV44_9ACTN|nr:hypothetical protein [Actinomadura alba]MBC6468725.1 hypothetical protein [Actinomadura alba]